MGSFKESKWQMWMQKEVHVYKNVSNEKEWALAAGSGKMRVPWLGALLTRAPVWTIKILFYFFRIKAPPYQTTNTHRSISQKMGTDRNICCA